MNTERLLSIAKITGAPNVECVLEDAMEVYEWVLSYQAHGEQIQTLRPSQQEILRKYDKVGEVALPPFIKRGEYATAHQLLNPPKVPWWRRKKK